MTALVGQSSHFPRGAKRVHFLVSLTSLEGVYDESMFDHFDAIVCAGRHHMEEFAALGQRSGWGGKVLLPAGYPSWMASAVPWRHPAIIRAKVLLRWCSHLRMLIT